MVLEGIALCNTACITCIWCILLSVFCPRFMNNLKQVDSSVCCTRKPTLKKKFSKIFNNSKLKDISQKSRNSSDLDSFKLKYKDQQNQKIMSICRRSSEINNCYLTRHFNGNDISGNCVTRVKDTVEIDNSTVDKRNDTNWITAETSKKHCTKIDDKILDHKNRRTEEASHLNSHYKSGEPNRRYKLYAKLSRRSSDSGEYFLERTNRDREFLKDTDYDVNDETSLMSSTRKY